MTVVRDEAWVEAEGPAGGEPEAGPGRRRFAGAGVTAGLLSVPMLWLLLFFLIPVVLVAAYSVGLLTLTSHDVYLSLACCALAVVLREVGPRWSFWFAPVLVLPLVFAGPVVLFHVPLEGLQLQPPPWPARGRRRS